MGGAKVVYGAEYDDRGEHQKEFDVFKEQHRKLLEEKARIQRRLETMRREYDFIQQLDPTDVNYM